MHHGYGYKKTDKKKKTIKLIEINKDVLCINTLEPFRISELPMLQSSWCLLEPADILLWKSIQLETKTLGYMY